MLTFEGRCSCRRAKLAHFVGHLPSSCRLTRCNTERFCTSKMDGKREGGQINLLQPVNLPLFLTVSLPSREARQLVIHSRPLLQADHLSFFCGYERLHALSSVVTSLHYRNFDLPYPHKCWRLSRSRQTHLSAVAFK